MKVIPPINTTPPWSITEAMLTASNVAEPGPGETEWVSGTTYAIGDVRIVASVHRAFLCKTDGAGTVSPQLDATKWKDIGPTNKYAMFDALRNSATVATDEITVSLAPGKRINAVAVMGLQADQIEVTLSVGGSVKYSRTENLILRRTTSWSEYFFGEFKFQPSFVAFDLPPYSNGTLTISITGTGEVRCGAVVIGTAVHIGKVQYDPEVDSLNFSVVERDQWGGAELKPVRQVPKTSQTLLLEKAQINRLAEVKNLTDAVPCVWSGLDDEIQNAYFESLLKLGVWKKFSWNLRDPMNARISLQIEEI